jgi:RimJ/RimL family protein N-acetyltransferase
MTGAPSLPRPPVDAVSLPGRTVDLERLDLTRHGRDLWHAIGADPALWGAIPPDPFPDEPAFTAWLAERIQRPDGALYAIVDKASRSAAGLFFLAQIVPSMGTLEIGLVYGPALRRRIGGTEAFFLIARYLLGTLRYRRLEWRCNTRHDASRRAAERFGFTLEGLLRQHRWIKGRNYDTAVFSMLDREWPAIEARLAAWLAPANFTADGRQITALADIA